MALINSLKSLPKLISKDSFDLGRLFRQQPFREVTGSELYYQLTYMTAIASSGLSRNRIISMASDLVIPPADYFRRVQLLVQKMGYDYIRACNTVGLGIQSEAMASLLLRMGNAFTAGQQERDFLAEETTVTSRIFEKEYERDLASLTKWTDAYAAITVSATLIVIINMTSSLIQHIGDALLIGLVVTAAATSGVTSWVLGRAAPKETIDLFSEEGPQAQRFALKLRYYTGAGTAMVAALLMYMGLPAGWTLLFCALLLLPLGIAALLAGRDIDRKDREFGPFLRSLGSMAVSTGATIAESLNRLDISSFPALEPDLLRLRHRLTAALDPEMCWRKFAVETGSKLIGETSRVFNDSVKLGADPDVVAFLSADFASRTIMLRAKRQVTASTFTWLTVVMHGIVSGLLVLIYEIVRNFVVLLDIATSQLSTDSTQSTAMSMPAFATPNVEFFRVTVLTMLLATAFINSYAISATDGGHHTKLAFYLAMMLLLSGVSLLALPGLVEGILQV